MNTFEIEKVIKEIQEENIKFPRICKPTGYEGIKIYKDKEPENEWVKVKRQTISEYDFKLDDTISALIYNIENHVVKHNTDFFISWFYEMLDRHGVKKTELSERVFVQITGTKNHIFIDGYYSFSFTHGCDFGENGKSYKVWINLEYII